VRTHHSFQCSDELWRAFKERAEQLECGVDWLLAEAMKRLLETGPGATRRQQQAPQPRKKATLPPIPRPPAPTTSASAAAQAPRKQAIGLMLIVNGTRTLVDRDAFVLGRSAREAQLVLRDPGVSRQHAIVERHGAAYVIVDMASTNGVIVNGSRVARAILRSGDMIMIGPFVVTVERGSVDA
jgi:pSer/pThr/pTyr-binding forkhead associated (FHA) protein